MHSLPNIGEAWVQLVRAVVQEGTPMASEGLELLGRSVRFAPGTGLDPILERFGDSGMIAEMKKVFFGPGSKELSHSYAKMMQGPGGRNDLQDVIDLLKAD